MVADTTRAHPELGNWAGMLVGTLEGRFLEMLVFATGARRVLEIGTFTGYSSIAMAAGLAPGGRITTCELDPVHAAAARQNIAASPYEERIEVIEGRAIDTVAGLPGPFDFVFIDADKAGYAVVLRGSAAQARAGRRHRRGQHPLARVGGRRRRHEHRRGRRPGLQRRAAADRRVVCVQLTELRDGVTLVRRADDPGWARAG